MKKLLIVGLLCINLAVLSACSGKSADGSPAASNVTEVPGSTAVQNTAEAPSSAVVQSTTEAPSSAAAQSTAEVPGSTAAQSATEVSSGPAAQEAKTGEEPLTAEQVEALEGTTLIGGVSLETSECAVMVTYYCENTDKTEESMNSLQEKIEQYAEEQGYVPVVNSGEGDRVYALQPNDLDGFTVIVLGETDSLKPGVESGGTRRFAQRNVIWQSLGEGTAWQVISVEKQDHYEEDGTEYPCYLIVLTEN